ncbi:nitroreductase family deazaflavin-dependent oxidoreductase [Nocardia terpenica]|uniref:nitroreductase family deazaflavin-dependent oxidoreductase n=1 Tax=Nocardia terpenica TaxID=455432 RepID=UPI0018933133|nr:nitroreductase family deazaflavin-dependent oxidoreductase [Nocardia terpenica]MBF6066135.1 nitroreductase family deazaflavin-dependent oxidoreductase [Nocardia terpenica]MBF6109174.1 nitroreductase family deazaflavin-dependent oxidoreductase [Nocardia terpenica]MBF6116379.1 nitroreductase family deazaflavin-dependent oxidoreductase [Nocardia terpenica]MBF6123536.1 nitroreductase family deazaflavin-dependent oxidoreductase [Nocardia terpenica]MBF6156813.1 nitroreductase family deazaflavin-d
MKIVRVVRPPTGISRWVYRLPLPLYRWHLGWMLGHRILVVNHIGRVSGKRRQAVLEIVSHDPRDGSYVVASGWGPDAAWYRNLRTTPDVTIQVGTRTIPVTAVPLPQAAGADLFARYAAGHRRAAKHLLPRLMGYSVDGSEADFRAVGERIPFLRFEPRR